jgi:hypothetical protein
MDKMVNEYNVNRLDPSPLFEKSKKILDVLSKVFGIKDDLLRAQSSIAVFYLVFRTAMFNQTVGRLTRKGFIDFNSELVNNRVLAEKDITLANFEYLEYERMSQQGTNDANSIKERTRILSEFLKI